MGFSSLFSPEPVALAVQLLPRKRGIE